MFLSCEVEDTRAGELMRKEMGNYLNCTILISSQSVDENRENKQTCLYLRLRRFSFEALRQNRFDFFRKYHIAFW